MMPFQAFFEKVQEQYGRGFPFVVYRKPNENTVKALFQKDLEVHWVSHFNESGFVFAPFDDRKKTILIPYSDSEMIQSEFIKSVKKTSCSISVENLTAKQFHTSLVQKGIESIQNNEFQKVVLSRKESVQMDEFSPINILKNLLNAYQTAFVYCFFHPKIGLWFGATPETLLKIEGNQLTTMALAGTQKCLDTPEVVWQEKERQEQQFVTDFILDSLKPSVETIYLSETKTVKAGNLLHLQTEIIANFKQETLNLKLLLNNLHPTPAVCGLPKETAKRFILKSENYDREFYTGFLGELNMMEKKSRNANKRNTENNAYASIKMVSNLYVNLRCMQLKENQAFIYIGGGITKDSKPEKEWEETVAKLQVIKSVL